MVGTRVSEYVLATNLYGFAQVSQGFFGWQAGSGEAELDGSFSPVI